MRLFIAIDVGDDTRAQLTRVRSALEPQLVGSRKPPRVAWVAPEAAHVTLRFIGEVEDDVARRVQEAMSEPFAIAPFEIEWTGVGTFPGGNRPRVVWIGAASGLEAAAALADAVNKRIEPIAGAGEDRAYRPHLTVARVKEPGARFDWAKALSTVKTGTTRTRVDQVVLYQSRTSPKGPTYTRLCVAPLRGVSR